MLTALRSPVVSSGYCSADSYLEISEDNHGNATQHSNLFNLNFKEFKLSIPIPASIKTSPTVLSSDLLDLPSALSASLATPSSSTTMASPRSSKKTGGGTVSTGGSSASTPAAQPQQQSNLLNKSAGSSTGIYQQSVLLRSRLQRLPLFAQFLEFSHSGPRATRDVVHQLWETFALGKPLCILFNLQDIPPSSKISEYADSIVDPDPLRKERQRAIALFIMGANNLKNVGFWEKDAPLFSISELVGDVMDTNGFVKVVATVLYLLDKLPSSVWSDQVENPCTNAFSSHEPVSSLTSRVDVERANLVRELIETERKYCQDLEIMQSYAEALRERNIVDADTIHKLFPALGKLTDFQRKLLIQIEATAEHSLDEQDWGQCFAQYEAEFAIYDAYIANYSNALDLAVAEQRTLTAASNIINPMQLPAFLIKPVQRLCRYPMLLESLLKRTPPSHVLHASLVEGVSAVKRIADGANGALREKENAETWEHTLSRIRDWKGMQLDNIGPLLLDDLFSVVGERRTYSEYHIFLFGRMLLLCRPKEMQPEADTTDKEKKGDGKLTPSFKRSQAISVAVLPPTPNSGTPSSFLSAGAVASRRAKTPLSIRGSLYIRNIMEVTPETSAPYVIRLKYKDRFEVNDWTLNCRNEEQVNLWHREITRLMNIWKLEEKDIRRSAKATLQEMKEQSITQSSSIESLDTMRSARRPVHPYHYTFEARPTRTRARNGSLDLGSKPELSNGPGRNRSCSVTSAVSDMYDPRDTNQDTKPHSAIPSASKSAADLALSPGTGSSNGDRSATSSHESPIILSSPHHSSRRNGYSHSRTGSQESEMSIGYASAVAELPRPTPTSGRLSGRMRASPIPPQLPPPSGPQPPLPIDEILSPCLTASYERSPYSSDSVKPLPIPPSSNLRQRVGHRLPAPLVPATPSTPVAGSIPTPQSTLPELPGKDARRPLSNRKSSTPLRGPRERGQSSRTPLSAYPPEEAFSSCSRSRSLSNPLVDGTDPRRVPPADLSLANRNHRQRHRRQGSESSNYTTDSVSILTTSETSAQDSSPITPLSFGEESKQSLAGSEFAQGPDHGRSREPCLVSGGGIIGRRAASGSSLDFIEGPPAYYAGVTPKTANYSSADGKTLLADSGAPSENASSTQLSTHRKGHSHTRSTSASGLGRTNPEGSMIAVRLHYDSSRFILRLSHATSRREFVEKIRQKIRLCGAAPIHSTPPDQLDPSQFAPEERVSYLNDANVFVPLDDDRDFAMAWRSVKCRRKDPADNDILVLGVGPTEHLRYNA